MPQHSSRQRTSIAEIARLTGLSAPTVSKVVNGRPGVSPSTRSRVESVIASYGYKRKSSAYGKTSRTVEMVFSHADSTSTIELIRGALSHAATLGIDITISEAPIGKDRTEQFRRILDRNPIGVVFELEDVTEQERQLFQSRTIPYVIINLGRGISEDRLSVGIDNWSGGLLAGRHLGQLGHRNIGVITGPATSESSSARLSGFRSGLREYGIELDPRLICSGNYQEQLAYEASEHMLTSDNPPTAIFAFNDVSALCVLNVAMRHGIRVPRDLSIVGFDDVFPMNVLGLTTVRQPIAMVAQEALDIIHRAQGKGCRPADHRATHYSADTAHHTYQHVRSGRRIGTHSLMLIHPFERRPYSSPGRCTRR